jgi:hypothetical protein
LTCKDIDNHRFKCTYIVIDRKDTNTNVFHKIVFLYVYVTPHEKNVLLSERKVVIVSVTKTVVKVIHESESSGSTRTIIIKEEDEDDRPTVQVINCFAPCFNQYISNPRVTIIGSPIYVTNIQQTNTIINTVNAQNSQVIIYNNAINNAYVNSGNTNLVGTTVNNPPPPPQYSASAPAAISTKPVSVVTSNPTAPNAGTQETSTSGWNCHSQNSNGTCPISFTANPNAGKVGINGGNVGMISSGGNDNSNSNINASAFGNQQPQQLNSGNSNENKKQNQNQSQSEPGNTPSSSPTPSTTITQGNSGNNNINNGSTNTNGHNKHRSNSHSQTNMQTCLDGSQVAADSSCPPSFEAGNGNNVNDNNGNNGNQESQPQQEQQQQPSTRICPDGSSISASDTCPPSHSGKGNDHNSKHQQSQANSQNQNQNQPDCNANTADPACAPPVPNGDSGNTISNPIQSKDNSNGNSNVQLERTKTCPDGSTIMASDTCPPPPPSSSKGESLLPSGDGNSNNSPGTGGSSGQTQDQTQTKICTDGSVIDIHDNCSKQNLQQDQIPIPSGPESSDNNGGSGSSSSISGSDTSSALGLHHHH